MSAIGPNDLVPSLASAGWDVAYRTYGSSHTTWIGLLVEWWIRLSPSAHWVLDGAPSFGTGRVGLGDAMFCDGNGPAGVLEVEGSDPEEKLWTIGQYFETRRPELSSIWFGLLLLYSYAPKGRDSARAFPPAEDPAVIQAARELSAKFPDRSLLVLALDRQFARYEGVRGTQEYYSGTLHRVTALHLRDGSERDRRVVFRRAAN